MDNYIGGSDKLAGLAVNIRDASAQFVQILIACHGLRLSRQVGMGDASERNKLTTLGQMDRGGDVVFAWGESTVWTVWSERDY